MRWFLVGVVALLAVLVVVVPSGAAIVDVGIYVVQDESSLSEREGVLQDVIDAGGTFTSPVTVTVDDLLVRNLASFVVVTREPGETEDFLMTFLTIQYFSDDSGVSFNGSVYVFASDEFDGSLQRGFSAGGDGVLWTADDVEVFGTDPQVDAIVAFGLTLSVEDTLPNRAYYEAEVEFDIRAQYRLFQSLVNPLFLGIGSPTVTVELIPEPGSLALLLVGGLTMLRRRR